MGYDEPKTVNNRVQTKHEFDIAIWNWKGTPKLSTTTPTKIHDALAVEKEKGR